MRTTSVGEVSSSAALDSTPTENVDLLSFFFLSLSYFFFVLLYLGKKSWLRGFAGN